MSIVRIGLAERASGLSRPAAQRHWRGNHARLFAQLPNLISYVQNHAVLDDHDEPLLGDPGFDIFAEVEFADEPTLDRAAASPYYRDVILADEKKLLDASRRTFLMTRRWLQTGTPHAGSYKVALFLTRKQEAAARAAEAKEMWLAESDLRAPRAYGALVYVVDRVGGTLVPAADIVLQHYFNALDDAREWHRNAQRRWNDAAPNGLAVTTAVIVTEVEVVPRPSIQRRAKVQS